MGIYPGQSLTLRQLRSVLTAASETATGGVRGVESTFGSPTVVSSFLGSKAGISRIYDHLQRRSVVCLCSPRAFLMSPIKNAQITQR